MSARGRGRGRRGRGGRGRGGSSRGRGRGSSRGYGTFRGRGGANNNTDRSEEQIKTYSINDEPQAYFTGTASCREHLAAQNENKDRYAATLSVMIDNKIQVAQNACIRALAMSWARGDKELVQAFLKFRSQFGLVEVLRALNILDAGRQCRVLENKLKFLQLSGAKVNPKKLGKLKSDIDNLNKLKPPLGSASGAVCKQVANWVRGFSADQFEFFAINFPKEPWKKLADICHLNPERDFPNATWFLPYCYDSGKVPEGSLVEKAHSLTAENVNEVVSQLDIPYSVVKKFSANLNPESKGRIASYEKKLDTVLWYYEDLRCKETDEALDARLANNEAVNLPNGKLLERLLTIKLLCNPSLSNTYNEQKYDEAEGDANFLHRLIDVAEPRLTSIRLSLESPIVVMGDASGSMGVAVRTSTIIASLLTAICSAKLVFFTTSTRDASFMPKTVREMLKLALTTQASGGTTPAASLWPYYTNKEIVKTFIVVTDEEENGVCNGGYNFADLYAKYYTEVYPAHIVFVSFLRNQHAVGQMVSKLQNLGYKPKQLKLEGHRPDLTKLDDLFAQLSAVTTQGFTEQLDAAEKEIKAQGVLAYVSGLDAVNKCPGYEVEQ